MNEQFQMKVMFNGELPQSSYTKYSEMRVLKGFQIRRGLASQCFSRTQNTRFNFTAKVSILIAAAYLFAAILILSLHYCFL